MAKTTSRLGDLLDGAVIDSYEVWEDYDVLSDA